MNETALKLNAADAGQLNFTLHKRRPEYGNARFELAAADREDILAGLSFLYGEERAAASMGELMRILQVYYAHKSERMLELEANYERRERFTQQDIVLITYGDLFKGSGASRPLHTLRQVLEHDGILRRIFNTLHILPFFPYSSDRGFAVTNFRLVDPQLGSWDDIEQIGSSYQLMFDAVINHASSQSPAFERFLDGDPAYQDVFVAYDSAQGLSAEQRAMLMRPRTSDVLTRFETLNGPRWVWTTFSPDQVDLNFRSPRVLLWIIETLLLYVRYGANMIRLDAVTYIWNEPGTSSANLAQGHAIVKLLRRILDAVAPGVALVTETNVPHRDNISYFGNGHDEAQMVYNFALPPLVLHAFYRGDASALAEWAAELEYPEQGATFFNVLDTHDGIGLMGVRGILPDAEISFIVEEALRRGALISYKSGPNGQHEPYEINTTWFSSLSTSQEERELQIKRYIASRSIALALRGVPGIYLHGLLASRNHTEGVKATKHNRDINRADVGVDELLERLRNPDSRISRLARELPKLTDVRKSMRAFHPRGSQQVLRLAPQVFSLLRRSPELDQMIVTLTNVSNAAVQLAVGQAQLGSTEARWLDMISGQEYEIVEGELKLELAPYDVLWLVPRP